MRPKDLGARLGVMTHKRVILQKSIVIRRKQAKNGEIYYGVKVL